MSLVRNFTVATGSAKQISISWDAPIGFNNTDDNLILTRTVSHFPMELFNESFPTKATDNRAVEIFNGKTIIGTDTGTISVSGDTITDTSASFPTTPDLKGRLIRDQASQVFTITSNTATTITVNLQDRTLTDGKYLVLPDFPSSARTQDNFEVDIRTTASAGSISNLVTISGGSLLVKEFTEDETANMIFIDGDSNRFLIKSNTTNTIQFFETDTPVLGPGMAILNSFVDSQPGPYTDTFLNKVEADARIGTGLRPDEWYYYTMFTLPEGANVAQAEFGASDSGVSTQGCSISPDEHNFGERLFNYWPTIYRLLDDGNLEDLMLTFGNTFDELYATTNKYNLQDSDKLLANAVLPLSEQTGLPAVGFSTGADTLRRIAKDMIGCWKLKGSKEGIATFIRKITTWDVTNGTGNFSTAIQDNIPNVSALRFFDINLGSTNTRFTETDPLLVPGARFATGLPGVVIPGFFTFREFVITIPEVALHLGSSGALTVVENTTTLTDITASFGTNNSLIGNSLIPNQEEINDIFEIIGNTNTSITVRGIIPNRNPGGRYIVLSPLNTKRFVILNKLLPVYIPFGTQAGFEFV